MTDNPTPPKDEQDTRRQTESKSPGAREDPKRRRHAYRGYPNNPEKGGGIHVGTGFAGVGPVGGAGSSGGGLVGDKTRESVEELEDDEK
jgi:hypothetical protein